MSYSWLSCGSVNEPWASMGRYTVADVVPVGERSARASTTPDAGTRWRGGGLFGHRRTRWPRCRWAIRPMPGMVAEAYQHLVRGDALHPAGAGVQAASRSTRPTGKAGRRPTNYYNHPFFHWGSGHQIIHNLERSRVRGRKRRSGAALPRPRLLPRHIRFRRAAIHASARQATGAAQSPPTGEGKPMGRIPAWISSDQPALHACS
jgi:hypothetical protein